MGIIFTREIKSLFRNIIAVSCIAIFALAAGILLTVNNLVAGFAGVQSVFSNMSLIAALTIPPVAATSFTNERKRDTEVLLRILPVTRTQVIFGKLLAIFAFFMVPTAVVAVIPALLSMLGAPDVAQGYIMLLMLVVAELFFITLAFMISALSRKSWKAVALSYAISAVLFIIGLISTLFSGVVKDAMRFVSPFRRFDPIVFDMLDLSSLLFYLSFSALFVYVTVAFWNKVRVCTDTARAKKRTTVIISAVMAAVVLGVNVAAAAVPESLRRVDISSNGILEISEPTQTYLEGLEEDVTVYLLNPSAMEEKLHSYIRRYCEQSSHLKLVEVDTTKDTEFLARYGMTVTPSLYSVIVESDRRWRLVDSESYYFYHHDQLGFMSPSEYISLGQYYEQMYAYYQSQGATQSDLSELYDIILSLAQDSTYCFGPEESITEAIAYVLADHIPTMYFATGHGEKNTSANPLDLTAIDELPVDASVLVINDPDSDYGTRETAMLQRYSDRGGRFLVITDENFNSMPNLCAFMACFGLSADEGVATVDGKTTLEAVANTNSEVFAGSPLTTLKLVNGSFLNATEVDGLKHVPLLAVEADKKESESEDEDTPNVRALALAVTKNGSEKLVWISGADTFNRSTSGLSDSEKADYQNAAYCVQYSTLWLRTYFKSGLSYELPKDFSTPMIAVESGAATFLGIIFIGLIPFGLIGATLMTVYVRKKRSKTVKISE